MKRINDFVLTYLEVLSIPLIVFGFGQFSDSISRWQFELMNDWAQIGLYGIGTLLITAVVAILWDRNDRDRRSTVHLWLQGIIAFYLVYMIAGYAFAKLLKTQFQPPNYVLETPIGDLPGFWLTWTYFGYSAAFANIIGWTQIVGCVFLLFRKTRLLGAIILIPVMVNICLVDHFFDVSPLAYFNALHFTLLLIFFVLLDADKLIAVIFSFKDTLTTANWQFWALNGIRVAVFALAFYKIYSLRESFQPKTKLNGVWRVEKIKLAGKELIPAQHADSLWSKVYLEWRYGCLFKFDPILFDRQKDQFGQYKVDEGKSELKINLNSTKEEKGDSLMLQYRFLSDSALVLVGVRQKDSIRMEWTRLK